MLFAQHELGGASQKTAVNDNLLKGPLNVTQHDITNALFLVSLAMRESCEYSSMHAKW